MNIMFLAFGKKDIYHIQTFFAILTVLRYKRKVDNITVYTDEIIRYKRLEGHIIIKELSAATITKWIDGKDYIFRAKIKAIEDCAETFPNQHLLFLDGDTVLKKNSLDEIEKILSDDKGIMYMNEGHPSKMKGASLRMWNALRGECIDGITISNTHDVWNSGVIGIPCQSLKKVISQALNVCDAIIDKNVRCFTAEQYAFSIAMQERGSLTSGTDWIAHYWGNKEDWHEMIRNFMIQSYMSDRNLVQDLEALATLPFDSLPLYVRKSNTRRRLIKFISRIFPN